MDLLSTDFNNIFKYLKLPDKFITTSSPITTSLIQKGLGYIESYGGSYW